VAAGLAVLAGEFASKDFGTFGEWLVPPPPSPPAEPVPEFTIPPWSEEERRREAERLAAEPERPPLDALAAMKLTGDDYDPPEPSLEPPVVFEPLLPVEIPPADWRREESEQVERELEGIEPSLDSYPAKRRS